ncbi:NPCBM/NEW2 domain-containing protein [Caldicellulosiruptor morganii]|uniref:Glycosyl hydrolase family 98 putative carbohydrate-binding module domain-containing protein n=1 Tax=Caldicellulosiruptor morganii TaxID=1387555 RepID=A0ABY7BMD6_9FIRM|nr:NPCBM/NEW2 domain-containing protein [Caldicellulosiruptor morganii]WAM34013.1 hypothetical protein OTK00_000160 [Caldicellulosiruptor morganii]
MKKYMFLVSTLFLLVSVYGLASTKPDYRQLYENLLKQYNNLKSENANLKKQISSLQSQVKLLNQKLANMPKEYEYDLVKDDITISEKLPFLSYKGRRYVHFESIITTFLNITKKDYVFDDKSKQVKIMSSFKKKEGTWLTDLSASPIGMYTSFGFNDENITVNYQKFFKNIWWKHWTNGAKFSLSYKIDGKFKKFSCWLVIADCSTSGSKGVVRIFGDDRLIGEYKIELNKKPVYAEVTVENVNTLTLQFERITANDMGDTCICVGDPLLLP